MSRRREPPLNSRLPLPSTARLRELLRYDPNTGALTWRVRRGGLATAGIVAGSQGSRGQLQVKVDGIRYQAHRVAWKIFTGKEPPEFLDHWDRNPSNNRFANLRAADRYQNARNASRHRDNISGFRGVSPLYYGGSRRRQREMGMKNRPIRSWRAQIQHRGRVIYLGEYKTREEAHATYLYHAMIYHGFFASDGEPDTPRFGFINTMVKHLGPDHSQQGEAT